VRAKAKRLLAHNTSITTSNLVDFDINDLISLLGGKDNITSVSNTISSVSVNLNNSINISKSDYEKFGIHGISKSYNKYTIVFGDHACDIKNKIDEIINNV
jgi:phosphotransferase system IIB component